MLNVALCETQKREYRMNNKFGVFRLRYIAFDTTLAVI